jgi:hypothetical protein
VISDSHAAYMAKDEYLRSTDLDTHYLYRAGGSADGGVFYHIRVVGVCVLAVCTLTVSSVGFRFSG